MRDSGMLPRISPKLGTLTRTNSEALVGAMTKAKRPPQDFTQGVAITSSMHPDAHTHIEPVRYGKGSNAMGLLTTMQVPGGGRIPRWLRFLGAVAAHPYIFLRSLSRAPLVGADHHRPGHAVSGQFADHLHSERSVRPTGC